MNRTADIEFNDVCRQLDDYLREHDMRRTPERYAIVRRAMALNSYFSVDSLCSALDDEAFHVSRTTVYNTVQLLVDASILRPLRLLGNDTRYCFAMRHNDESDSVYLVCLDCGKIKEVKGNDAAAKLRTTQFRGFIPAISRSVSTAVVPHAGARPAGTLSPVHPGPLKRPDNSVTKKLLYNWQ